jgi:hypothetical protein
MATTGNLLQDETGAYGLHPAELRLLQEQAARDAEWEAAAQRRAEEIQAKCDVIDEAFSPYIEPYLELEISDRAKADFKRLKDSSASRGLPHLLPQAVAQFLLDEACKHSRAHVRRLCRNISTVCCALDLKDPTQDTLVRAFMRRLAWTKKPSPQIQKGN